MASRRHNAIPGLLDNIFSIFATIVSRDDHEQQAARADILTQNWSRSWVDSVYLTITWPTGAAAEMD
jgi:hypothetical protein